VLSQVDAGFHRLLLRRLGLWRHLPTAQVVTGRRHLPQLYPLMMDRATFDVHAPLEVQDDATGSSHTIHGCGTQRMNRNPFVPARYGQERQRKPHFWPWRLRADLLQP
jgi:hypothetical protein